MHDNLEAMLADGWLQNRAQLFVDRKFVAPFSDTSTVSCWEEYDVIPREMLKRNIFASLEREGLYAGDVMIF